MLFLPAPKNKIKPQRENKWTCNKPIMNGGPELESYMKQPPP